MEYIKIKNTDLNVSRIALGCMRISNMDIASLEKLITTALDLGINFFDHADIYGGWKVRKFIW
ncbi:MAG: aldo/keto reductase [Beduini sp.]